MIKSFDSIMTGDYILDKAQEHFDQENYVDCVKYIVFYFDDCSLECQSRLATVAGRCYYELGSIDSAIMSLKRAIACDDDYADPLYYLALYQQESKNKIGVQDAFFELNHVDTDGDLAQEILKMIVADAQLDEEFKLVSSAETKERVMLNAENLLKQNSLDEALAMLKDLNNYLNDDVDVLNDMSIICLYMENMDDAKKYAERALLLDEDNFNSYFILAQVAKLEDSEEKLAQITDLLIKEEYTDIAMLRKVVAMLELSCGNDKINVYVDGYTDKNAIERLMMKSISLFNLGDRDGAICIMDDVQKLYGDLSLARTYKEYFADTHFTSAVVGEFMELPSGYVTEYDEKEYDIVLDTNQVNHELVMIKAFGLYDEVKLYQWLIDNKEEIGEDYIDIYLHYINAFDFISPLNKAAIIMFLIKEFKLEEFTIYNHGGANGVYFEDVVGISKFPPQYNDAYVLAFSVASNISRGFENSLMTSMNDFLNAMGDRQVEFENVRVLASAILCNSYIIVADNTIARVAAVMNTDEQSIKECLDIIRAGGNFFDLEQDEIFSKHIKRVMSRFGAIETVDD